MKPNKQIEPIMQYTSLLQESTPLSFEGPGRARHSRAGRPKLFVSLPNFVVSKKIVLNI